ncbi:GNAT family N-acetyltransferase [Actinomadura sp. 6N118]|uniref:GNAT family N-acetyltransferase n=1 Tax=Actinomadura sp. 6N118 TaxID=3375151 RepID=UPI0037986EEB
MLGSIKLWELDCYLDGDLRRMTDAPKPEATTVMLRVMELSDVPLVAELHRRCLHQGFFVDLGERFLGHYYRTFVTSPAAVTLVAEREGVFAGFLVGTVDERVHRRHVARLDRGRLARAGALSLTLRPRLTAKFVRTRARRYAQGLDRARQSGTESRPSKTTGVLHHMAVNDTARRSGVGRMLVDGYATLARTQGTSRLTLEAREDNPGAQRFYEDLGWTPRDKHAGVDGGEWLTYGLDL